MCSSNGRQTLNDEMARQDDQIAKLNKDKKGLDENLRKTQDDLQAEEDKCNHLNKLKQKLEANIDDVSADCCCFCNSFKLFYTPQFLYKCVVVC